MKTIGVDLWADQIRGAGKNHATCTRPATMPTRHKASYRDLFVGAYDSFAAQCREVSEPGIAIVAVDRANGRPMGIVRVLARVQRHVASIIGRHDQCDLFLTGHDRLALRHLVVIVDPVSDWRLGATVRYRILDLRTTDGFTDENDRPLRGLQCEGPAVLGCGGFALFVLPLGDPSDFPADAKDAWSFLPERVYFDELQRSPQGSLPQMPRFRTQAQEPDPLRETVTGLGQRSMIIRTHGPRDTAVSLVASGDIAGMLELVGPRNRGTIRIGADELRDGVLIGRYARCNNAQLADDPSLSRVHALLIQIDDAVLAIDTASLNGTRESGHAATRLIQIHGDRELVLGTATRARWHWMS